MVFTNDLDFSALLALTRGAGPSVLQLRTQDLMPAAVGGTVVPLLEEHRDALLAGAIITLDEHGSRVRILPLKSGPANLGVQLTSNRLMAILACERIRYSCDRTRAAKGAARCVSEAVARS